MATTTGTGGAVRPGRRQAEKVSFLNRREVREAIYQVLIVVGLVLLFYMIVTNTIENLKQQNIASGFGFWNSTAGVPISFSLVDYDGAKHSYGRAFLVGLLNTALVAIIGVFLATIVGFVMGIARLSSNWLVAKLAQAYVEIGRNVPLLLQLFVWYFPILKSLPEPFKREDGKTVSTSIELPGGLILNNRGLKTPKPVWQDGIEWVLVAALIGIIAVALLARWARRRQLATGKRFPVWSLAPLIVLGLPLLAFLALGKPVAFEYPVLGRFNWSGGNELPPEFVALLMGLVFYTGAYIAEIVRAGIQGVPKGQKEAARALGLSTGQMMRLVVLPQAFRIIVPPLTSQYLNLTKNSTLAVGIGFQDFFNISGTVLNQTNQAVEVVIIVMATYLTFSLLTSLFMNWFNARMALVER